MLNILFEYRFDFYASKIKYVSLKKIGKRTFILNIYLCVSQYYTLTS